MATTRSATARAMAHRLGSSPAGRAMARARANSAHIAARKTTSKGIPPHIRNVTYCDSVYCQTMELGRTGPYPESRWARMAGTYCCCLLYTSDAADEEDSVD